jgi:hypothetical protein
MSSEIHQKTFEDHYYESERLNGEARKELTKLRAALDDAIDTVIFYSNSDEFSESHAQLDWGLVNNPVAMQDKGKTAREFLSKHKELIKGEV